MTRSTGYVSELACEPLRRPSIAVTTKMRVAADRGRFFSPSHPFAFLNPCEDKQETEGSATVQYLFLTVAGV